MLAISSKVISTCFAFAAFAVCLVAGGVAGRSFENLLLESTLVMLACWVVGLPLARLMTDTIKAHIRQYEADHPLPSQSEMTFDPHEANPDAALDVDSAAASTPDSAASRGSGAGSSSQRPNEPGGVAAAQAA